MRVTVAGEWPAEGLAALTLPKGPFGEAVKGCVRSASERF